MSCSLKPSTSRSASALKKSRPRKLNHTLQASQMWGFGATASNCRVVCVCLLGSPAPACMLLGWLAPAACSLVVVEPCGGQQLYSSCALLCSHLTAVVPNVRPTTPAKRHLADGHSIQYGSTNCKSHSPACCLLLGLRTSTQQIVYDVFEWQGPQEVDTPLHACCQLMRSDMRQGDSSSSSFSYALEPGIYHCQVSAGAFNLLFL